jgi:hypothetical protein
MTTTASTTDHSHTTALDDYFFDLQGFLVLRNALSDAEMTSLNDAINRFPTVGMGEWIHNAQRRDYTADTGFILQPVPPMRRGDTRIPLEAPHNRPS